MLRTHAGSPAPARERGVMLIEALIAILIFSIGILAVVGMQGTAIKEVTSAKYRSEAAFLTQELLAQMWTDSGNIAAYAFAGSGTPPPKIQDWVDKVKARLPDAANSLPTVELKAPITATGATVEINVRWRLPEEATQGLPAHGHRVVAYVNPSAS